MVPATQPDRLPCCPCSIWAGSVGLGRLCAERLYSPRAGRAEFDGATPSTRDQWSLD
jgi:hypothetical protein